MCVSWLPRLWEKALLTPQDEKWLSLQLGRGCRGKCCALAHFAARVLSVVMDVKLGKVIPRKTQNEAKET